MGFLQTAARRRRQGIVLTLTQQVQARLLGTNGIALDPSDLTTMWTDTGTVTPVALNGDPIGHLQSKYGLVTRDFIQTSGARPAWASPASMDFDGADDNLDESASTMFQSVPAAFVAWRVFFDSLASAPAITYYSTNAANNHRVSMAATAAGAMNLATRRVDGDVVNVFNSAAGVLLTGTSHVVMMQLDYAGTGLATAWVDGVQVINSAMTGVVGNTSATASVRGILGAYSTGLNRINGRMGRGIMAPFLTDAADRTLFTAWFNEVAI